MKSFIITFVVFMGIDLIWLTLVAKNLYKNQIGFLMKSSPNWIAAIIFYLIFVFGLIHFVINPAIKDISFLGVLLNGMLFGFITYATFDLTNLAVLKDWPLQITIIDLLWGTTLGGSVSMISYFLQTKVL